MRTNPDLHRFSGYNQNYSQNFSTDQLGRVPSEDSMEYRQSLYNVQPVHVNLPSRDQKIFQSEVQQADAYAASARRTRMKKQLANKRILYSALNHQENQIRMQKSSNRRNIAGVLNVGRVPEEEILAESPCLYPQTSDRNSRSQFSIDYQIKRSQIPSSRMLSKPDSSERPSHAFESNKKSVAPNAQTVNDQQSQEQHTFHMPGNIFMAASNIDNPHRQKRRQVAKPPLQVRKIPVTDKQKNSIDDLVKIQNNPKKRVPSQTFYNNSSHNQTVNINIYMDPEKLAILAGSQSLQAISNQKSPQKSKARRNLSRGQSPGVDSKKAAKTQSFGKGQ